MWDWVKPIVDIFAGAAPAVGEGTQALGAGAATGAEAAGSGGFNIMPFLGDLWGTASNFAASDFGKAAIGTGIGLGAQALAGGPAGPENFPGNASFGPLPGMSGQTGTAAATPPPPGTNASPILNENQPGIKQSTGLDVEEDIKKRMAPQGGGMQVSV